MPNYNGVWSLSTQYQYVADWPVKPFNYLSSGTDAGLFVSANGTNVLDFVTISTTGNASDFGDATANNYPEDHTIIFDTEIVNQDLYITNKEVSGNASLQNYYIEMEEVKVKDAEMAVVNYRAGLLHGE